MAGWTNVMHIDQWGKAMFRAVSTWMGDHNKCAVFYEFKILKCFFSALKTNIKTKYLQGEDAPLSQISFKIIKSPLKNFAVHNEFTFPEGFTIPSFPFDHIYNWLLPYKTWTVLSRKGALLPTLFPSVISMRVAPNQNLSSMLFKYRPLHFTFPFGHIYS